MSQSYYSMFGSPLQLLLEDDIANGYNRALKAFFDAQKNHKELHGVPWTPDQPIWVQTNDEDQAAHDAIARLMNLLIEINGGALELPEEQMTDDYLVKLDI